MTGQIAGSGGFAFIKVGDFSHVNPIVLEQLQARFPHLRPAVIDLSDLKLVRRRDLPGLVLSVATEFGPSACMTGRKLRQCFLRSSYIMRRICAAVSERLGHTKPVFTLQTQSLFDGSVSGVPHFIYTDHTHLANLTYPLPEATTPVSRKWTGIERTIYANARMVFTMSHNISRSLIEEYGCPPQKVECVYAGSNVGGELSRDIDSSRFRAQRILFVGLNWERKGGPVLLEAFRILRRSHPEARLTIVGCAPAIDDAGVDVVGAVPLQEVPRFYRSATVFCLPTLNEPFGLVFLEAAAYGLPVVATSIGAIPEIVVDGETGYLVRPQDPVELARRLGDLIDDPQRCEQIGLRAREWIRQRYSWEQTGERMASHIIRLSCGNAAAGAPAPRPIVPSAGLARLEGL